MVDSSHNLVDRIHMSRSVDLGHGVEDKCFQDSSTALNGNLNKLHLQDGFEPNGQIKLLPLQLMRSDGACSSTQCRYIEGIMDQGGGRMAG